MPEERVSASTCIEQSSPSGKRELTLLKGNFIFLASVDDGPEDPKQTRGVIHAEIILCGLYLSYYFSSSL